VIGARGVCAVAFQGRLTCFDLSNGNALWSRDVSSSAGIAMDNRNVYVTDDKSAIHAFDLRAGSSLWKQDKLSLRQVTAPIIRRGLVVVADVAGVVHFLNREDGQFVARASTDGSPIVAAPRPLAGAALVQTTKGGLFAIDTE
jgi:outer membrane protein assembly factor BamB